MKRKQCLTVLGLALSVAALLLSGPAMAAITATATRGEFAHDLDGQISSSDLLQGLIATELPGDLGWHPANTNPADQLPAFTDGAGTLSTLTGLLNDFPGEGTPTKLLQYDFEGPVDIDQIHILTGNSNNSDGRIFSTFVVRVSTNGGANYAPLGGIVPNFDGGVTANNFGYYQSDASGMINKETGMPGTTEDAANLVEIFDDGGAVIATGVTNIQFDFYASNNSDGQSGDPWGAEVEPYEGLNPFTGTDDGLKRVISSPLVWEIDVIGQAAAVQNADFDADADVDGDDFLAWQRGNGLSDTATLADGDANDDKNVDATDLGIWQTQFGNTTATATLAAVPEPSALASLLAGLLAGAGLLRGKRL